MSHHSAHPLADRSGRPDHVVRVGAAGVSIGGDGVTVMAGPCAVEDFESLLATAQGLRGMGVQVLRGGAYKPRTSPHSFRGLGTAGLEMLARARDATGLAIVTEVLTPADVEHVAAVADMVQVGTRNMGNTALLEAVGACGRPVLLKRGMGASIEELLCAAEYVLAAGTADVVLCERGIRSFDPALRNALDLGAVALLAELTHLPIVVDPSHATGKASLVPAVAAGSVAAGAHGLLVEVHENPATAKIDGDQTIDLPTAQAMMTTLAAVAAATGRRMTGSRSQVAA